MLSVDEAVRLVLEQSCRLPPRSTPLGRASDLVLAEDIVSQTDSPPHDKATVDGYAVRAADVAAGASELDVVEEVTAGQVPTKALASGQAARIMTGAPLPEGADAMVMLERSEALPWVGFRERVRITQPDVRPGQNIMPRAASIKRGDTVLRAGTVLRPIEIGILAELGCGKVPIYPPVLVGVLPTGNELVAAGQTPAPGQIHNSNGPMLAACATRCGAMPVPLGIGRDDRRELKKVIATGLDCGVLVISGGVSAGVLDLVPALLEELGVRKIFHKVHLKPGKPLWFGEYQAGEHRAIVFGLPGNPVSSLVCFELFVRPCLGRLMGRELGLERRCAQLCRDFTHRGDRPTYHPARLGAPGDGAGGREQVVEPLKWQGSGDLCTLAGANALAHFPAGDRCYRAGEMIDVLLL